jgi:tetratricopeptide (TPR) repeat protein
VLFAVHPIHTEAVTGISGLPDVASTFFYLLSFYLYVRSQTILSGRYLFSVVCFAVAAFFKEPALTLPVILLAYDYLFRDERTRLLDYVKRYSPYLVIGIGYLASRIHALGAFAFQTRHDTLNAGQYAMTGFFLFIQYLDKLLVPLNLNALYVIHPITSFFQVKGVFSLMATVIFTALLLIALKKNRLAFLSLLFVIVPLLPVLYTPVLGVTAFADRYLYLPSVGFVLLVAIFLSWTRDKLPRAAKTITIVFIVIGGLYAIGTINRNKIWHDNFIFWSDTVKKSPDSVQARNNLGLTYASQRLFDKAIAEYQSALRLKPDLVETHNNLGLAYASHGLLDKAITEFQTALRLKPDFLEARNNLGLTYASQGLLDKAITEFQTALRLAPDFVKAHYNLGVTYELQGLSNKAIAEYQTTLRLAPDFHRARQRLNDIVSRTR